MNRTQRRAAERHANKAASTPPPAPPAPEEETTNELPEASPKAESSEARTNANRANAQFSTGPTSPAGRAKVSLNALKTGLTGRTILLPSDDADQYESLLLDFQKQFHPVGAVETHHVQALVDIAWRLDRIPALESALVALGRRELAEAHPQEAAERDALEIEIGVRARCDKSFRNFQLQEHRLVRRREKEMAELARLQQTRQANETAELQRASQAFLLAKHQHQPCNLAALGFEFSTRQFNAFLAKLPPEDKQNLLKDALAELAQSAETMQMAA